MHHTCSAVFFDIGGTLGSPRLSAPPIRLLGLDVYPYVEGVLEQFATRGTPLGIISNTGNETQETMNVVLRKADLYSYFESELLIYSSVVGMEKNSTEIFKLAAHRAGLGSSPQRCLFVGEDSQERSFAQQAGWKVAPHPLLANEVLGGARLRFVRINRPPGRLQKNWVQFLQRMPLVPLRVSGQGGTTILAVAAERALGLLANALFDVQPLGKWNDPLTSDLYIIRDDQALCSGALTDGGQAEQFFCDELDSDLFESSLEDGLLVQIPAHRSIEEIHFDDAEHGHNLRLIADMSLFAQLAEPAQGVMPRQAVAPERNLTEPEVQTIALLDAAAITRILNRYIGTSPLGDSPGTTIDSRHILNPGNHRAASQLAADFQAIGGPAFEVSMHSFTHDGRSYLNVVAELAGTSDEVVLVTAHMDSTASSSSPYDPLVDPAPGADDDGSGVAAVLASAKVIRDLAGSNRPLRTIRFVLFNAEEQGLVGSQKYAADAAAAGEKIEAVYQMDMIGYNVLPPATWEAHVGYLPSATVQTRSAALAERMGRLAGTVSPALSTMQIYQSASASDRDPAEGRSDHAAFQQRGYAACLASEDFFAGPGPGAPGPERNPNYHRKADTFIDPEYTGGIARCVVAAAWIAACPSPLPVKQGEDNMAIKMGSGSTTPGTTAWKQYSGNKGVYLDIDTSSCKFSSTPKYFTSLGGNSSHWSTTGATSIYQPTATGFRVYVRWSSGDDLSPAQANGSKWHMEWFGVES